MDHDFRGAEGAKALSRLNRRSFSSDRADLCLVPEKDVDVREANSDGFNPRFRPPPRIRRHIQRGRRTVSAGAGEKRGRRFPHEPACPPEAGPMDVVRSSNRLNRNVAEPQSRVRPRVRDERPPPGGPRQGHRASCRPAGIDAQARADAVLPVSVAQESRVRIRPDRADERRRGTQARHLEREVRRVATRQRIEARDLRLDISRREIRHRRRDEVDDPVADGDDAGRSRGHPSRPPKALPLQLLDHQLVVCRPTASGAEQTPVRVANRVGSFPSAVPAQRIGRCHRSLRRNPRA